MYIYICTCTYTLHIHVHVCTGYLLKYIIMDIEVRTQVEDYFYDLIL